MSIGGGDTVLAFRHAHVTCAFERPVAPIRSGSGFLPIEIKSMFIR
jgi:hypothetical protein